MSINADKFYFHFVDISFFFFIYIEALGILRFDSNSRPLDLIPHLRHLYQMLGGLCAH